MTHTEEIVLTCQLAVQIMASQSMTMDHALTEARRMIQRATELQLQRTAQGG